MSVPSENVLSQLAQVVPDTVIEVTFAKSAMSYRLILYVPASENDT